MSVRGEYRPLITATREAKRWDLSDAERASLIWLAGFEHCTVENVAAVITRARTR
ncbi:MAG: hypothetical protein ACRDRW_08470 [Pseudonocardiaceae bacterium]